MSSASWHTAEFDELSEKRVNFENNYNNCSESETKKNSKYREEIGTDVEIQRSCRFLKNSSKNNQRIKCVSYSWKIPWIIILLSVVQVVVYFIACEDSITFLTFKPQYKYDLWRFLTYHTIHFNLTHLLLNIVLQILIAFPLESTEGHFRVFVVYFSGIIFGAIGSLIVHPTQSIVGSSGGIYSLLFSHLSQCALNWRIISHRVFRLTAISVLFLSDLIFLILKHVYWNNMEPKISFTAHMSGGIAGFFTGLILFQKKKTKK